MGTIPNLTRFEEVPLAKKGKPRSYLKIRWFRGHRFDRERIESVTSIFITPPTLSELKRRLYSRSTDSKESIERRLESAKMEIKAIGEFDFVIINSDIDISVEHFVTIANSARLKLS